MSGSLRIALAQINPVVGDLAGNLEKHLEIINQARDAKQADLVIFPELSICGYPPEDLLLRQDFLQRCQVTLQTLTSSVEGIQVILGHPLLDQGDEGKAGNVYNALSLIEDGVVRQVYRKRFLPNYNVFDEKRYFTAADQAVVVDISGVTVGLTICEDIWEDGPVSESVAAGAEIVVSINASPFHIRKSFQREEGVVCKKAHDFVVPIIYVNQVGGQDELVFDGASLVADKTGAVVKRLPAFSEALEVVEFSKGCFVSSEPEPRPGDSAMAYDAIVLGVRDYIGKNGFKGVVLGLSGGIDSALTLAMVVDAIGAQRVTAVMMPSRYTSQMSLDDAKSEAEALGVDYQIISIEPMFRTTMQQLAPMFEGLAADTTEENVQARSRGILLMAISNKLGYLVVTTGNKSEMAVGYATLYGDMVGGFSAIKDVPKTLVYELAAWRNQVSPVIPENVLTRPPSAELAPDQKDEDSLPPYDVLDPILEAFVEQDLSIDQIVARGYDRETVQQVIMMVTRNEYKRRQAAPGVRITPRAFGRDRRYPITSHFFKQDQ